MADVAMNFRRIKRLNSLVFLPLLVKSLYMYYPRYIAARS